MSSVPTPGWVDSSQSFTFSTLSSFIKNGYHVKHTPSALRAHTQVDLRGRAPELSLCIVVVFFRLKPSVASHTLESLSAGLLGLHRAPCPPHSHHLPPLLVTFGYEAEASAPLSLLGLLCRLTLPLLAFPGLLPSLQALPSDFLSLDFFLEDFRPSWVPPAPWLSWFFSY